MLRLLIISHLFPNDVERSKGIFVFDQVKVISKFHKIEVISPIIWLPFYTFYDQLRHLNKIEHKCLFHNLKVNYPRYLAIPLRIKSKTLMWIAGILYLIGIGFEVLKIKSKFKFNIIHSHFAFPDGFASVILGKILKKPVIITVHGSDINLYTTEMNHLKPMVIYALKHAAHIITVSSDLKNKVIELGIDDSEISVVPNGYSSDLFKPMDQVGVRKELGIDLNKKVLLFVGNLVYIKGVTYLIEAMALISKSRNDIILIIVGKGCLEVQIKQMIEKYNLFNSVSLVGSQPHEKMPLWMNACDLLVLPSISEGFGAVIVEANACGKPIVATNVGGIPEICSQITSKLVPPKDPNALVKSILEVLDLSFDSINIIKENKRFEYNKIADELNKIYYKTINDCDSHDQ